MTGSRGFDELREKEFAELRELVVAARGGDRYATSALLRRLAPKLRGYIKRQLLKGGPAGLADVEDVLQITLLAIYTKLHTYDQREPLSSWVYAIARYKVIDRIRAAHHSRLETNIDDAFDIAAPDEIAPAEASRDLGVLLRTLPPRTRAVIEAVKLEGVSVAEAAHRVGMSEGAVKMAINRGLKRLAALFDGSG